MKRQRRTLGRVKYGPPLAAVVPPDGKHVGIRLVEVDGRTRARETELPTRLIRDRVSSYAQSVRGLGPRLTPWRPGQSDVAGGVRLAQYKRNKEWEALRGAGAAFAFLATKRMWLG